MRLRCRLREFRGRRSIREMEELSGIRRGQLSLIERGRLLPTDAQLETLERAYGHPLDEWYDWRGPTAVVEMEEAPA